ncbi:serine hydrolase, partial [Nonomuraea dietziae]
LGLVDELALPVIRELTGLPVPALPTPPEQRREVDAAPYIGTYSAPSAVLEVTAADGGLDVTTIPGEFMAKAGVQRRTERYVHLSGQTFITVEAEAGGHLPITFVLEGGRAAYLHNGRAVPRA